MSQQPNQTNDRVEPVQVDGFRSNEDEIRSRAFLISCQRATEGGRGNPFTDWLQAENELKQDAESLARRLQRVKRGEFD